MAEAADEIERLRAALNKERSTCFHAETEVWSLRAGLREIVATAEHNRLFPNIGMGLCDQIARRLLGEEK